MNLTNEQLDALLTYAVTEADGLRASVLPAAQIRRDWAAGEIDGCPPDLLSRGATHIDWAALPCWVQYVAQDASGEWWGYGDEPYTGTAAWFCRGRDAQLDITVHNWRDSLHRRPESK